MLFVVKYLCESGRTPVMLYKTTIKISKNKKEKTGTSESFSDEKDRSKQ